VTLKQLYHHALDKVAGSKAVATALTYTNHQRPAQIIALGKAAADMAAGAWQHYCGKIPTLIITKYGHVNDNVKAADWVNFIEAGHPVPDEQSLIAGELLLNTVKGLSGDDNLLFLVSGGASALAESLIDGVSRDELQLLNNRWLSEGLIIDQINEQRAQLSQIKGGKLLTHFNGNLVEVLLISDVRDDKLAVIGSGIGSHHLLKNADCHTCIIASNAKARYAIDQHAHEQGIKVQYNREDLYDDVYHLAKRIGRMLIEGPQGLYILGGEPTIKLPPNPGKGGRNQSLALALAIELCGQQNIEVLVAGTDGTDGPTDAAGAIIDGNTLTDTKTGIDYKQNAQQALLAADAYPLLADLGALLVTGPTGTNVMDLLIAHKK